ncbi:hypothetical protein L1887_13329 [Cichorium endivia]|nr:hypothetical protein L1887_13329 [Cichorium endivia]
MQVQMCMACLFVPGSCTFSLHFVLLFFKLWEQGLAGYIDSLFPLQTEKGEHSLIYIQLSRNGSSFVENERNS